MVHSQISFSLKKTTAYIVLWAMLALQVVLAVHNTVHTPLEHTHQHAICEVAHFNCTKGTPTPIALAALPSLVILQHIAFPWKEDVLSFAPISYFLVRAPPSIL